MNPIATNAKNRNRHNGKIKLEIELRYKNLEAIPAMRLAMPPEPQRAMKIRMPMRFF
jgi:hypothetical protein